MKKLSFFPLFFLFFIHATAQQQHYNLLVGTYTNTCESKGIYVYDFDTKTGDFRLKNTSPQTINPSYLALSPEATLVYSVNEEGAKSTVSAFSFNPADGAMKYLNKQDAHGADPCYIIADNNNVITANYSGGTIAVFGRNADGTLTEAKQVIQHQGKGPNAQRQESAHVHMTVFSPDKKFVIANDLGTDKISVYKYDANGGANTLTLDHSFAVKSGSGPRHFAFSPNGKLAYLIHELDGTVTAFQYKKGHFTKIQETTIVAKDFKGDISSADIHISADVKFLYATNRGDANDITIFKISSKGLLSQIGQMSSGGKGPRNFAIDPSGEYVLVGHQYTANIVIFKRDKKTGLLRPTGKEIEVCAPVCLVFTPVK
ncbi:lactonase family protein [Flavobacterium kingsejongi]|uniref:6-phosphogluconolactonase n=1 Tax=Flavobacterium kingsejongi TaxID=1678728 RepID=A0A2S1LSF6_9FLAO|nr:lactonase family protein [Flavobacterium kingsejongi]AWG26693.1 6-phosphogluconolactonase [Flavobacterium kingsejongi]